MTFRLVINMTLIALLLGYLLWWWVVPPPSAGPWQDTHERVAQVTRAGSEVTVANVRDFGYDREGVPVRESWIDRTYDLDELARTWFIVEPFGGGEAIAHTMFSFEFTTGETVVVSLEARRRPGQGFQPVRAALLPTYPYLWVWATERDMFANSTFVSEDDLLLYELTISERAQRAIFTELVSQTDDRAERARWYHTLFSNCTNVLARAVNRAVPGAVPLDAAWYLPGYSDEFLYGEGYLDTSVPLAQAKLRAFVSPHLSRTYDPNTPARTFSAELREAMGLPFSTTPEEAHGDTHGDRNPQAGSALLLD